MYSFFIEILYTIANAVIYAVRFVFAKAKEAATAEAPDKIKSEA